jgi:hypothetical protein
MKESIYTLILYLKRTDSAILLPYSVESSEINRTPLFVSTIAHPHPQATLPQTVDQCALGKGRFYDSKHIITIL